MQWRTMWCLSLQAPRSITSGSARSMWKQQQQKNARAQKWEPKGACMVSQKLLSTVKCRPLANAGFSSASSALPKRDSLWSFLYTEVKLVNKKACLDGYHSCLSRIKALGMVNKKKKVFMYIFLTGSEIPRGEEILRRQTKKCYINNSFGQLTLGACSSEILRLRKVSRVRRAFWRRPCPRPSHWH